MKSVLIVGAVSLGLSLMGSFYAKAETIGLPYAKVQSVVVSAEDRLGGCGVRLSVNPGDTAYMCYESTYISFSCNGRFNDKSIASEMFAMAKEAFETGKQVRIRVEDTEKHNGACVAKRIEIQN